MNPLVGRLLAGISEKQEELEYVARVLHEDTGQVLTVVGLQLDVLRQDYSVTVPELAQRVTELQALLERAVDGIRQISYRLNPGIVPRSGLRYALDTLTGRMRDSTSATIRFLMDSHVRVPMPIAEVFFEIAELALTNAIQHSDAKIIEMVLQPSSQGARLEIRDNGKGFNPAVAKERGGMGLLWMEHRAQRAGLSFSIESEPGKGASLHAVYREVNQPEPASAD